MASMKTITCKCGCGRQKEVRTADIKRGWGKYFSKACKAKHQECRTGQFSRFKERQDNDSLYYDFDMHPHSEEAVQGDW